MSSRPFFSVVIPTRNRCDMLRLAISSLIKQKFKNFEIIVSDNSDNKQQAINFSYIERLNLKNLTYIKPNEILTMHDNWEFALTHATGLYVGFLIDKTMFRKAALKEVFYLLNQDLSIDIVNYLNGGIEYYPGKLFQYKFQGPVVRDKNASHYFYPKKELERRFSLKTSIREEGDAYVLGKICFGFYSNRLINKIKSLHGRMFFPTSCDYTSCVLALAYASRAIFLKKILLYSINNFSGNGFLSQNKKGHALNFVKSYDPTLNSLSNLPIPQLYSSLHNFCVADYTILNRLKVVDYEINKENFIRLCQKDLQCFPFSSNEEYHQQKELLLNYAKENDMQENIFPLLDLEDKPLAKISLTKKISDFLRKKSTWKEKILFILKKIIFYIKPKWFIEID